MVFGWRNLILCGAIPQHEAQLKIVACVDVSAFTESDFDTSIHLYKHGLSIHTVSGA